jgi:hypothetical protein
MPTVTGMSPGSTTKSTRVRFDMQVTVVERLSEFGVDVSSLPISSCWSRSATVQHLPHGEMA